MIGVIVLGIVFGTILYCELTNWSGEDELGNEYGPGEDGEPVKIKEGDNR